MTDVPDRLTVDAVVPNVPSKWQSLMPGANGTWVQFIVGAIALMPENDLREAIGRIDGIAGADLHRAVLVALLDVRVLLESGDSG